MVQSSTVRERKWKDVAIEAARLIGTAAWKIISRTIVWAAAGVTGRAVKRALVVRIEKYLLTRVRAERTAGSGGGVDVEKLIEIAPLEAQKAVGGMIESFMSKQLLVMSSLACVAFALPPAVLSFFR